MRGELDTIILDVPYYRQQRWYTCGPACLRMVLSYLQIDKSENEISNLCQADFFGTTCEQIATAANQLNLHSEVVINTTVDDLKQILETQFPLIALIDAGILYRDILGIGHFIVIIGIQGEDIVYHDPEIGSSCRARTVDLLEAWRQFEFLGVKIWSPERK